MWQSNRTAHYHVALDKLVAEGAAYPCACSRKDIEAALHHMGTRRPRHGELIYPGTCRNGLAGSTARAWRLRTNIEAFYTQNRPLAQAKYAQTAIDSIAFDLPNTTVHWQDRRLGEQLQDVAAEVGDFVLYRADGLFAYQLAVVVDDAAQGITHVVRGEDLVDNTARQILLQRALGLPTPRYLHTPLVLGANAEKLSKQNGAEALDLTDPLVALNEAAGVLGLSTQAATPSEALAAWVTAWRIKFS
jgi:glutamyl-Q tRNA(Asp) synthetase